jgi:hypothetical protein
VAKPYLTPGSGYSGCRHCHELTYHSAQTHDRWVDALRRNPELLVAIVENPGAALDSRLILALKTAGRRRCGTTSAVPPRHKG